MKKKPDDEMIKQVKRVYGLRTKESWQTIYDELKKTMGNFPCDDERFEIEAETRAIKTIINHK